MRVIVMFDLPTTTSADLKEYRKFRRFLIKSGFIMQQESVYSKLALNSSAVEAITSNIRKNKPPTGNVQLLTITERQYSSIELIVGNRESEIIDSDERLVIL
ncbi:MAG: CRISPR-associated endonuclease Cas2 [Ruminococcaceae bacterium]|nr:CRISPR-associated endonuclease Cas2 [Oscillospiraceae bacterium]